MANQNRTTKPQPTQGSAAARQAAQAPAADAAKMAKQAADKAELDKMAQAKQAEAVKEVVAETTAEGSVATADAAAAAEGSLGAVSGEAAVAEAGAAGAAGTAAAISPLAIGAGVVGVAAVAAAAGGGSSGGSGSQPIAQNNTQQAAQNQGSQKPATPAAEQPAQDTKPAEGTNKPAEGAKPTEPAKEEEPAKQADSKPADQPKVDPTPVEDLTKPATAGGTAEAPTVAADGVTNLTKFADLFKTAGANGGEAEFIKISRILSAENAKDAEARAVDSDNSRAYEVIDAGKPITLAEAQTMAAKLGGKLMSIDTAEEKAWLDKNLFGALGEYDGDKSLAEAAAKSDSDKAAQQKVLDGQLASNGAWLGKNTTEGADAKANAVIRNGNNADGDGAMKLYEAAGTTLSKFVIEYEGYKSPLLLDGKPVVEGQIINKAEAGKLAWNADLNKAGKITYQAVDSNDSDKAKPVAGAEKHSMTLSESADVKHPMTTPANPSAQDKPAQGGTEVKPGNDAPQADQNGQDNQNSDHQPAKPELPATAQGTAEAPQVAANGETQLANVASAFEKAAGEGKNVEFIKIVKVDTSEGDAGTRIFREVETTSKVAGKAADAPAPAGTKSITAYEVIKTEEPITRTQAEEMAKARGGKLLSIDNAEEAKFIGEKLFGTLGEYDSDASVAEVQGGDSAKAAQQEVLNGQLKNNGAWLGKDGTDGAVANADAIIRNGNGTDLPKGYKAYDFTGDKLSRFVIEIENYKAPLTLNGEPVVDGQIINKADFDKLVWNGDHNMGGKITYVAVQSNKPDAPNVEGAAAKTLTVSESAAITHPTAPATAPAQNQQQGGAGTHEAQDNKGQAGGEDQKAPEGGNKTGNPPKGEEHNANGGEHKTDAPQNSTTGGDANKGNTNPSGQGTAASGSTGGADAQGGSKSQSGGTDAQGGSSKTQEGGSDSKAGDTTQNAGSQSQGQTPPSKPAGTPEGQTGGTVSQPDQPPVKAAPSYEPNKSVSVAHDATDAKIAKEVFEGTNPANKPEAVKATGFAAGTLKVDGAAITDGALIKAADFDKVTWDASKGEGGSFKFTPVQANGDALAQGGAEQTITINEASAPVQAKPAPTYDANKTVDVAHDVTDAKIAKEVFEGTTPANKPAAVTVTGFTAGTLKVNGQAINPGDKIAAENFDKVTWDASKGEGGTFKFTPVQANGDALAQGGAEQTITINEAPAAPVVNAEPKLGEYASEKSVVNVGRDADPVKLDSKLFAGTDPEKAPDAVKITVVHGPDNQPTNDGVLSYTVGGQKHSLTSGSFLDKANFDKVEWDAKADAHNAGTYKVQFKPVTADHQEIASATEHNFDVKEASGVPTYESSKMTFNVDTHDGKQFVPEALFKGENSDTAPLYVWIKGSTEQDGGSDGHVFMRLADGSNGGLGKDLTTNGATSGEVISWSDLGKVQWDAAHNNGGTIRFQPLDGDKQPIGQAQEIKVTESPATPQGSSETQTQESSGTQNLNPAAIFNPQGAGAQLKSLAAYTQAEPSSNLLDDLHNQITPLI